MTESKILSREAAKKQIEQWQAEGKKIVFTNGCFDIVHLGHIDYLEKAQALGDKLVLGLNTDASVRRLKGESRPVINEYARARMMSAMSFIDTVILFDEETPKELIETLCPNILVKGDDYTIENIVGAEFVMAHGGEVKTISLVKGYSTSSIIQKIKESY
ncbi:Bifunctional protein HldE [Emticicia aquatica]|uniref:D-glycero-beta-D-manno-heptose 1-phosphate adenylyltransferase n=1 Tax=Emticicia aquatica TaxID=1681835 RepID=A0ABN8EVM4_9BACT|nr:D-glycero-beta-D-manno-heptose 1-phosphate adenylyltransferase [Emticicia aquatica]CAH0995858.1 Bifunctional protein HldE [Emticicia aquatica]